MKRRLLTAAGCAAGVVALGLGATAALAVTTEVPAPIESVAAGGDSLSDLGRALESSFASRPEVVEVYAARDYAPVWTQAADGALTPAGEALVVALERAPDHALPARRYKAGIEAARGELDPVKREVALTRAFLTYGRDISSGLLEPRSIDRDIAVRPERPEPAALLSGIAAASDPAAFLAGLQPQSEDYRRLVAELAAMRRLASEPSVWGPELAAGPTLREGDRGPRVRQLRERLAVLGDFVSESRPVEAKTASGVKVAANEVTTDATPAAFPAASADPQNFDVALTDAVRRFQRRHGLNEDGLVGPATLEQLNVSAAFRADQIAVNLERMRWLNRDLGRRHVKVNIPDFMMRVIEDGRQVFESRVVVGQRRHQTPEFSDMMDHMVVNPTWFVPRSIAVNEMLPKLREDPSYLDRKGYRLSGADPWSIDWTTVTPSTFPGSIRQPPGDDNALGRVKFMFPNDFAIYLHDTPQRHLFARDVRAYSHGCVRIEKPLEFARFLLEGQEADPAGAFERWLATGRERYVQLDEHLPVHITYRTAWIDETGTSQFRGDVYGRDVQVMDAMRAAGVELIDG